MQYDSSCTISKNFIISLLILFLTVDLSLLLSLLENFIICLIVKNVRLKDSRLVSFLFLSYYLSLFYFSILIFLYLFLILDLAKKNNVILHVTVTSWSHMLLSLL